MTLRPWSHIRAGYVTTEAVAVVSVIVIAVASFVGQAISNSGGMQTIQTAGIVGVMVIVFKFLAEERRATRAHEEHREKREKDDREADRRVLTMLHESLEAQTRVIEARIPEIHEQVAKTEHLNRSVEEQTQAIKDLREQFIQPKREQP